MLGMFLKKTEFLVAVGTTFQHQQAISNLWKEQIRLLQIVMIKIKLRDFIFWI